MEEAARTKILIVEDHRDMMVILKKYLQDQKFTVIEAENAEIGLQKFDEEQPDIVLMDIMLPGMSGLEAISRIKEQETNGSYIPIIIITAKNDVDDIVHGLDCGADDYVVKPFHFDELTARINTAIRLKKLNELLVEKSAELENANIQISNLNQSLIQKNRELRKNVYSLHSLFEISMELNSILELHRLVNSTLLTLVGQFSCKSALFIISEQSNINTFKVVNSKGLYQRDIDQIAIDRKDPLIVFLEKNPYTAFLEQLQANVTNSAAIPLLQAVKMQIVAPVLVKNSIEGLICLGPRVKKQQYQDAEFEHITILSNIISIAVSNASLYNEVEQLSYTDAMTELHNYRYFELRLKEEVIRHKRTNSGLSLLILDVDHFKNYNDTMGHPAGDDVLRKLARILKITVRENDIVARYGGEEFAVILPAVDKVGANILAERLRERVENTYFDHEEIQPLGKVTISIGVASLPEDADNYSDLTQRADRALYEAKRSGRNQVKIFDANS